MDIARIPQDQGERAYHTQSQIVSDGSDDAEEEIPSKVTHPPKVFFFPSLITAVEWNPRPCRTSVVSPECTQQRHLLYQAAIVCNFASSKYFYC